MKNEKPRSITANQFEKGETQSASIGVPVTITANQIEKGDTQAAFISVEEAVKLKSEIPRDAREAVKDFIEELISQLSDAVGEFIVKIPDELIQYTEAIMDIICKSTGWC